MQKKQITKSISIGEKIRHHQTVERLFLFLFAVPLSVALTLSGAVFLSAPYAHADVVPTFGVGGIFAPGEDDIFSYIDIPGVEECLPVVSVIGPYGNNWGVYQWGMSPTEPPIGPPYDYWDDSYAVNDFVTPHVGEFMLGTAIPSPDPELCPLPVLITSGDSLFPAVTGDE